MKVIDLLNKIANGEEVPKKIKYENVIYWYDETEDNEMAKYKDKDIEWLFADCYLNDTIEILKEEKKMPEKLDQTLNLIDVEEKGYYRCIMENIFKINEIIDYLKSKGDE